MALSHQRIFFISVILYKKEKDVNNIEEVIEINLGSEVTPTIIKLGKGCLHEERNPIENLIDKYKDSLPIFMII